jgi:hypothetical protein
MLPELGLGRKGYEIAKDFGGISNLPSQLLFYLLLSKPTAHSEDAGDQ